MNRNNEGKLDIKLAFSYVENEGRTMEDEIGICIEKESAYYKSNPNKNTNTIKMLVSVFHKG